MPARKTRSASAPRPAARIEVISTTAGEYSHNDRLAAEKRACARYKRFGAFLCQDYEPDTRVLGLQGMRVVYADPKSRVMVLEPLRRAS